MPPVKKTTKNYKKRVPAEGQTKVEQVPAPEQAPVGAVDGGLIELEKKMKNVTRKLFQVGKLKDKQQNGDELELTQILKIGTEGALLEELAKLKAQMDQ